MLDVPMIDNVGDMLQLAMMAYNIPPKALAIQAKCSTSHIYSAMDNIRSLPKKALHEISKLGLHGAATVAMATTGFSRTFAHLLIDRHIQSMIVMSDELDENVSTQRKHLSRMLVNKNCRNDLSADEYQVLESTAQTMLDRINMDWNLIAQLETQYGLELTNYCSSTKKTACAGTQTTSRIKK